MTTLLHRKSKQSLPRNEQQTCAPDANPLENSPKATRPFLAYPKDCRRRLARNIADDWTGQGAISWGLPNNLLGYNLPSKLREDEKVQKQTRNGNLAKSFQQINDSVRNLQKLASMETAACLIQTPDRSQTGGNIFSLDSFLDARFHIFDQTNYLLRFKHLK